MPLGLRVLFPQNDQIAIVDVDETGRATGSSTNYTICGEIRRMGESDDSLNRLAVRDGILPK